MVELGFNSFSFQEGGSPLSTSSAMAKTHPAALALRGNLLQTFFSSKRNKRFYQSLSMIPSDEFVKMPRSLDVSASSSQTPSGFRKPEVMKWEDNMTTNKATFIGVVSRDVRIRYLDSGKIVANSSIQVSRPTKEASWFYLEFWGDLAEIAAAHVKVQDTISVSGSVWSEKALGKDGLEKTFAKVVADDLKFVKAFQAKENAMQVRKIGCVELWENLFINPSDWFDWRYQKVSDRSPDFKHKLSGQALWLDNKGTPFWVRQRLEKEKDLKFQHDRSVQEKWEDFFAYRSRWWDNRFNKASPSSPDFLHKETREALWIDSQDNPQWIKEKLKSL